MGLKRALRIKQIKEDIELELRRTFSTDGQA